MKQGRIEAAIERIGLGNIALVERYRYDAGMADPEWDYSPSRQMRESRKETTLKDVLDDLWDDGWYEDQFDRIASLNDVAGLLQDVLSEGDCYGVSLLPLDQDEAQQKDAERKRMEGLAGEVARKHGVTVDSLAFIDAVKEEIAAVEDRREAWDSGEARAERMAACVMSLGSARGAEVYYDDNNFEGGRFSNSLGTLYGILEWLAAECPLLWAKSQEGQQG
jgi:hypothetical protein